MILQIIGTRPQYEKLVRIPGDYVVDTGQHYSNTLTYDKPKVDDTLSWDGVASCVRQFMLLKLHPRIVVVYGDTYSTMAGALYAKKTGAILVHVEAGIRSHVPTIEECIRKRVDRWADYCLCTDNQAATNLLRECKDIKRVEVVGDVMRDRFVKAWAMARCANNVLMTIHRRENLEKLPEIFADLKQYERVIFYCHPHTSKYIKDNDIKIPLNVCVLEPVDYYDIVNSLLRAKLVITDSGGLIREAAWSGCEYKYIGVNMWQKQMQFCNNPVAADNIRNFINGIIE